MKLSRIIEYVIWAALAGVFLVLLLRRASGPEEGTAAAAFDLPLLAEQGRFNLEDHRGKRVLLEIFASWCGACRRAAPAFADAYADHGKNVSFVGVMVDDDADAAARTVQDWEIPYDVVLDDGSVSRSYRVQMLPTVVLIDEHGMVERVWTGAPSRSQLESWLTGL